MENRQYYARTAGELHKQRTVRRLEVTDDALLSGVLYEGIENELQKLSVCDEEAAMKPCGKESAASSASSAVSAGPALTASTSDASSTIASTSETRFPDGKTRDPTA